MIAIVFSDDLERGNDGFWVFQADDECVETLSSLVAKGREAVFVGDDNYVAIEAHFRERAEG